MNSDLKSLLTARDAEIERLKELLKMWHTDYCNRPHNLGDCQTFDLLYPPVPTEPKEDWKRVKGCWNKFEKVTKPPASDTPEKPKDFIEQFRLYFANLARKYPERTLFTEGRDPIQDELVGLHHLAESSDTPARPEWVDAILKAVDDEPEVPGPMPDEMWKAFRNDRDAIEEGIRIAVRQTKEGIRQRIQEALALVGKEK